MPKYAARIDANQPDIVKGLRELGAYVLILSAYGRGVPDLLVCWDYPNRGHWRFLFVEIKANEKSKLTKAEQAFFDAFPGAAIVAWGIQQIIDWYERS